MRKLLALGIPAALQLEAEIGVFLIGTGDINAAAEHLLHLLDDRDAARRQGAAGRARVREHFSPEGFCARLERVYQAL